MRPGKLAGLLNSTRLGEVTSETRVRRNIVRAGLRVGDSTRVNVLGYAAWLVAAWHARRGPGAAGGLTGYNALRASSAARNRRLSAAGRDIAQLPDVADPDRRTACECAHFSTCRRAGAPAPPPLPHPHGRQRGPPPEDDPYLWLTHCQYYTDDAEAGTHRRGDGAGTSAPPVSRQKRLVVPCALG